MKAPATASPQRRAVLGRAAVALVAPGALMAAPALASTATAPAWHSRFEQGLADWPRRSTGWGDANRRFLAEGGVDGRLMRVLLARGGIDPGSMRRRGLPESGTGFKARVLAAGADAATLEYRLRFAPGFEFVRGGKLPGLFGGTGPSGGRIPTGHDGFSLRLMWRSQGQGECYAYLPSSQGHGSSLLAGSLRFAPGAWHRLAIAVRLNAPGRADGSLALWQDGTRVGRLDGLLLRHTEALKVDGVFFDVFFGGGDDTWAARADTHIDFAEFALHSGRADGA